MTTPSRHWKIGAGGLLLLVALCACVATDAGYYGGGGVYVSGVYEEPGYVYGGWGPGYHVGPPRGGYAGHGPDRGGRGAPSIPQGPRGGGGGRHR